jgi:YVTN family beta-propeller protein
MTSLTLWKSAFVFRAFARVKSFLLVVVLSFLAGSLGLAQEAAVFSQSANTVPTNRIVAKIPVGSVPQFCVVSPDSATLYVANAFSGTVSVIDTATNTVTFVISLGGPLGQLALTPDGTQLYVANNVLGSGHNTVSVINTKTRTVSATLDVSGAYYLTVTPDGKSVWVPNGAGIVIIDTATNQISSTVSTNSSTLPEELVFSPDGSHAHVLCQLVGAGDSSYGLLKIDTSTQKLVQLYWAKLKLAHGIAMAPDGGKLYFFIVPPNFRTSLTRQVVVFNTAQDKIETKILLKYGGYVGQCAVTPNGKYVYFAETDQTVMIDTATDLVVGQAIPVRHSADVAIAPNGRHAYVSNINSEVYAIGISPAQ